MSNKRLPPLLLARLCLVLGCMTVVIAGDAIPPAAQPPVATPGASAQSPIAGEIPPALRNARPVKSSPALSLPALMRLRWDALLEELLRTANPVPPEPEVYRTDGLSDDPDPVGNTQEGDDSDDDERKGSKQGWKSQSSSKPPDPFGTGKGGSSQINLPLP